MSIFTCDVSVSLDGYSAGPNQSIDQPFGDGVGDGHILHAWMFDHFEVNRDEVAAITAAGAYIMGRNMFSPGRGAWDPSWVGWWGREPPYHAPVFVLTHHEREPVELAGGTTFHFVTGGPQEALDRARTVAGDRSVSIGGGVRTINEYLAIGAIDELRLHVAPVVVDADYVRRRCRSKQRSANSELSSPRSVLNGQSSSTGSTPPTHTSPRRTRKMPSRGFPEPRRARARGANFGHESGWTVNQSRDESRSVKAVGRGAVGGGHRVDVIRHGVGRGQTVRDGEAVVLVDARDRAVGQAMPAGGRHEHHVELEPAGVLGGDPAHIVETPIHSVHDEVDRGSYLPGKLASDAIEVGRIDVRVPDPGVDVGELVAAAGTK